MVNLTLFMMNGWEKGTSQTEMVWPLRHLRCDIWSTLGDECHGGEALPTNEDCYHVKVEVMINVVECLEPMVNF